MDNWRKLELIGGSLLVAFLLILLVALLMSEFSSGGSKPVAPGAPPSSTISPSPSPVPAGA